MVEESGNEFQFHFVGLLLFIYDVCNFLNVNDERNFGKKKKKHFDHQIRPSVVVQ